MCTGDYVQHVSCYLQDYDAVQSLLQDYDTVQSPQQPWQPELGLFSLKATTQNKPQIHMPIVPALRRLTT